MSLLLSILTSPSFAEETICPITGKESWEKMTESDFSKENVKLQLENLLKYFNGNIVVAEEFIYQSMVVIERAALLQRIEYWKDDPKNLEHATNLFCDFMTEKAFWVH